ncbi:nucleolar DEAD-box protein required for synthesis of 60S ribosomal subunit [Gnomoniopsis smithogilvyi]|uniref:RNA helicase n=1 Tax=Gnomoniopsis smithogilvyi TaxID=1191159 RepID=A0A9W9CX16_9PEZI|nr:nucleolar DEAD-box protein required for synthesis of 60S ribosomal subunit [Gnomoniopsis smithogilvyi]
MAPSKRKADDDFILTLSDNEDMPVEEEEVLMAPPQKKAKTKTNKKSKKADKAEDNAEAEGIWGKPDEDDGAMDSDFEFVTGDNDLVQEFEGWGFENAKNLMGDQRKDVLDDIIRRRREKKEGKTNGGPEPKQPEHPTSEEEEDEVMLGDDDDDEVLNENAFGMNVGSDVEESGEEDNLGDASDDEDGEENSEDEDDAAASDNDSVATPTGHPDDDAHESDSDDEEDAEEAAKREAFFAPEEKAKPGNKNDSGSFQTMSLSRPILRGLTNVGFSKPTPIQAKAIPIGLMGKDVVGGAVTGSGKTGAFIVPILERLLYRPKKTVKLASHTDIKFCLAVGGLSLKVQEAELRLRPDVVIATPGRFIDHMRNSASFAVETVEILVLDEADRMLEDGFADELNEILTSLPKSRQTMLFSATMTSSVDKLIRVGMNKPVRIMVDSQKKTVNTLSQEFVRLRPGREEKRMGYLLYICKNLYTERVIIFFRQKKIAHQVRIIFGLLGLSCAELHGSLNQAQRIASVEAFRDGKVSYLLATDLASRGLDIKGVDTVINYEAPQSLDIYLHRVGRTARAGRSGVAITLAAEPDRRVVKAAVKAGKQQGAKITSRVIDSAEADKWQTQVDELEDEVEMIVAEEKEEKQMQQVEMQVQKGENLIKHEDEIKGRPKRTWFESERDKEAAKEAGAAQLNGLREKLKKKDHGKLSNKDRKKLDAHSERKEGRSWKKGAAERAGKGAVLELKKNNSKKKADKKKPKDKVKDGPAFKSAKARGPKKVGSAKGKKMK